MCTVSWIHSPDGYQLLCNRDEKRTRKPALPPAVRAADGVKYIAPSDGDFGGTWIVTNQFGISLCLLNGYSTEPLPAPKSRGLLLLELSNAERLGDLEKRLRTLSLAWYAAFTMVALEPRRPAMIFEWNGKHRSFIDEGDSVMPLVSSSYDPAGVRERRIRQLQRVALSVDTLYFFHESHGVRPDAYSPCMHREDAETVSFSWICVDESKVDFFYTPGAPCQWKPGQHIILERTCSA